MQVQLFRIDELPLERKQELVRHAETQLTEARKPWRRWSEWTDRLKSCTTALNISRLLELEDLGEEAQSLFTDLKEWGRNA